MLSFGGGIEHTIDYMKVGFHQIYGENGLGKSNFHRLLSIGIYFNYPHQVGSMVNDREKNGYIEHTIDSNNHLWVIHSYFTKTKLARITITKDGEDQDWGNPSNAQGLITENIVSIPESVFNNIFCSSINNIGSIIKMNAKDSREITNNVFDLNNINLVAKLLAPDSAAVNAEYVSLINDKEKIEEVILNINESLKDHKADKEKEKKEKIKANRIKLDAQNSELKTLESELSTLNLNLGVRKDALQLHEMFDKQLKFQHNLASSLKIESRLAEIKQLIEGEDGINYKQKIATLDSSKVSYDKHRKDLTSLEKDLSFSKIDLKSQEEEILHWRDKRDKIEQYKDFLSRMNSVISNKKKLSVVIGHINNHREKILTNDEDEKKADEPLSILLEEITKLENKIKFLKNPTCAVCDADFSSESNVELLEESKTKLVQLSSDKAGLQLILSTRKNDTRDRNISIRKLKEQQSELIGEIKRTSKENPYGLNINYNTFEDISEITKWKPTYYSKREGINKEIQELGAKIIKSGTKIAELEESIKKLNNSIESLVFVAKQHDVDYDSYEKTDNEYNYLDLHEIKEDLNKEVTKISAELAELQVNIKNYNNSEIPEKISDVERPKDSVEEINKHITSIKGEISEKELAIKELGEEIAVVKSEIAELNKEDEDDAYESFQKRLNLNESKKEEIKGKMLVKLDDKLQFDIIKHLYSDGHLKAELINKVVGGINSLISKICSEYEFEVSAEFNSNFESTIYKFGEEIHYDQTSTGQKKILTIVSIIAIITYYKQKYPSINFVFLDEALSSLSNVNTHKILKAVEDYLINKLNMNVFITSHSFISNQLFIDSYSLSVDKNYTTIKYE